MFKHQSMEIIEHIGDVCLTTLGKSYNQYATWIKAEPNKDNPNGIYCIANGGLEAVVIKYRAVLEKQRNG